MLTFYRSIIDDDLNNLRERERFAVALQHQVVSDVFSAIAGDILFLSQQNELNEYLSTGNESLLDEIGVEYISTSKQRQIYDQIRLFDNNGMEVVRINENHGAPIRIPAKELQSKKNRYYFEDCFKLGREEIFISPFDLNIEHDQIEKPFKPMIRLGTPVFDKNGEKRGIVLVNYYGKKLQDKIIESEAVSEGSTMLLNADGYWLLSSQPEQEWGFMFKDEQRSLAVVDQAAWKEITSMEQGQIESTKGIYTFKTVYPVKKTGYRSSTGSSEAFGQSTGEIGHDDYRWYLVSFFSSEKIASTTKNILVKFFSVGAGLFFLIAVGALIIAFAVTKQKLYQSQLQIMALFDPLTQLPNRTLYFDRIHMAVEHCRRYTSQFGLLYIDLDGFKQVNDTLGHEAGDELLVVIGNIFLKACRKSDTVARLGGDEFAIIFAELESLQTLEAFANRIIDSLKSPIDLKAGKATVGASIGIAVFPADSDNLEALMNLADKAMYSSKRQGKNMYTLSSSLEPEEVPEHL